MNTAGLGVTNTVTEFVTAPQPLLSAVVVIITLPEYVESQVTAPALSMLPAPDGDNDQAKPVALLPEPE
jgi:hypothetical protein